MPTNPGKAKRKTKSRKRPVTRARRPSKSPARAKARESHGNGRSDSRQREYSQIVENGRPTHVIVPIDEYEELIRSGMVANAVIQIEGGDHEFINERSLKLVLAVKHITAARRARGLTQEQLGAKLNLPQSQISRIERNPDHTTVRTLKKIARALGVDIAALV